LAFLILWLPAAEAAKNLKPSVNAGLDQLVGLSEIVSLDAVASDPDGTIVRYVWQQIEIGDTRVSLVKSNSPSNYFTSSAHIKGGKQLTLFFKVTVTNNKNATASDIVKITIPKGAQPPPKTVTLLVNKTGAGNAAALGQVNGTSSDGATVIDCGNQCSRIVTVGSTITLTPISNLNAIFTGWSGNVNCPGVGPCIVSMNTDQTVTANFDLKKFSLTVIKTGNGTVASDIGNIQCGDVCTANFLPADVVKLTATPEPGYLAPKGWFCLGSSPVCQLTVSTGQTDRQINADFIPMPPAPAFQPLNDTGITGCSNITSPDLPCPQSGYLGQDAESGRDVTNNNDADGHAGFSFTKIDNNGSAVALGDAAAWQCVKDNVTGLMWEIKTDDSGLHDKDWTYTWYDGITGTANGGSCGLTSACDTVAYVKAVNVAGWCGKNNWRMPKVEELRSIVSYDRGLLGAVIDDTYFPNTISDGYLAAEKMLSTGANTGGGAAINFQSGYLYDSFVFKKAYVRLVSGQ
jgi:hypothetical protein